MTVNNPDPNSTNPALTVGVIGAAVGAVLTLLIAFGVDLTEDQTTAILGVVSTVGPILLAVITREQVYAPATVARLLRAKSVSPPDTELRR